jgi:hypothetical protein
MGTGRPYFLAALLAGAVAVAGCADLPSATGTFDRTLTVTGPVRLELNTGSGDVRVSTGASGSVRIHAEFSVHAWPWENPSQRESTIAKNPPIEQQGNLIRVGQGGLGNVDIKYEIEVPPETEAHAVTGSGDLEIHDIKGPLSVSTGSGDVTADGIAEQTQIRTGSGNIELSGIAAAVELSTGSGDSKLASIQGEIRAHSGSGDIEVSEPGAAVAADTSSGDIVVSKMSSDLRLRTSSGDITVDGQPADVSYWEVHTSSGDVELRLGSTPSFRLDARSSSGDIQTSIPLVIEGSESKHELRAKAGDGKARIDVQTGSGGITLE